MPFAGFSGGAKIGRNSPCPCGSGKKYKRCCGSVVLTPTKPLGVLRSVPLAIQRKLEELKVRRAQRERQQGLGRPIISTEFKKHRVVAVGNRVFTSEKWKTFHDFLFDYIKDVLGREWGVAEQAKRLAARHPIMQWNERLGQLAKTTEEGKVQSRPITGAVGAYLGLAYNLYLVAHNVSIQTRLIERLKEPGTFWGAYYETFVAAVFIKAGFELEFENEGDRTRTHCEFAARHARSGIRYSVEAKSRNFLAALTGDAGQHGSELRLRAWRQVSGALHKTADNIRVVFVDMSSPRHKTSSQIMSLLKAGQRELRASEHQKVNGQSAPEAYVFLTSDPHHLTLEESGIGRGVLGEGFRIPDFKEGAKFPSLRDALNAREKHGDMFHLMESLRDHHEVPSTFDGELPEYAFGNQLPRLVVGQTYVIPTPDGETSAVLQDAVVMENERTVYGVYQRLDGGNSVICTNKLSEEEFAAYRRHPETFFGVLKKQWNSNGDPLKMYDFWFHGYRDASHEQLLQQLQGSPDFEQIKSMPAEELRKILAERLTYKVMADQRQAAERLKANAVDTSNVSDASDSV